MVITLETLREGVLDLQDAPVILKTWVGKDKDLEFSPHIKDVGEYGVEWRRWWKSLQPQSRIGACEWPLLKVGWSIEGWDGLSKGSLDGFVLILVSLIW